MKKLLKTLFILAAFAAAGCAVYYYFFMRQKKPQVELYFDDGSMLAFPGNSADAAPFVEAADEILLKSPVVD
jgi:hypothetical protein